jgi:hypothetical protein
VPTPVEWFNQGSLNHLVMPIRNEERRRKPL